MSKFAWHEAFAEKCNHKHDNYEEFASLARSVMFAKRPFPEDAVRELENTFIAKVAKVHAERIGLRMAIGTLWFIVAVSTSPGQAVMWVHFFRWLQSKLLVAWRYQAASDLEVALVDVYVLVISKGLPSPEAMNQLWEMQKVDGANSLDALTEADYVS